MGDHAGGGYQMLGFGAVSAGISLVIVAIVQWHKSRAESAARRQRRATASQTIVRHAPGDPLPQRIRDEIPQKLFAEEDIAEGDRLCAICLTEYEPKEELLLLPCKHSFHTTCVELWFKAHSTCPSCRYHLCHKTHPAPVEGVTADVESGSSGAPPEPQPPAEAPATVALDAAEACASLEHVTVDVQLEPLVGASPPCAELLSDEPHVDPTTAVELQLDSREGADKQHEWGGRQGRGHIPECLICDEEQAAPDAERHAEMTATPCGDQYTASYGHSHRWAQPQPV